MPELTCPRCKETVAHAEGEPPVCPACGLGAREAEQAANAVPTPAYPEPVGAAPAGGSESSWKVPVAVGVAVVVVLAGALAAYQFLGSEPSALSQEEAEEAARLAMSGLAHDLEAPDGGELRSMEGSFEFSSDDFGSGTMEMAMAWGSGDTGYVLFDVATNGGFSFRFRMEGYCTPERDVVVFGDTVYEARPHPEGSCMELLSEEDASLEIPQFDPADLPDGAEVEVTPHADGSVTAAFSDPEGDYVLEVDAEGRARSLSLSSPEGEGSIVVDYGPRQPIVIPEPDERLPSTVSAFCFLFDGRCEMVLSGGDDAPWEDFEVRVYAGDAEVGVDAPEQVFPLAAGNASRGGFTITIHPDGDGLLGDGDTLDLRAPGDDYQVVLWDTWADRDVQDVPIPAPALAWWLVGLAAAAFVLRRR